MESGAKVNKIQGGGVSFIEHIYINAFDKGNRFIWKVQRAQGLTSKKVKIAGADKLYATNKNRKYNSIHQIQTDFIPKGRKPKDYKVKTSLGRSSLKKEPLD